MASLNWIVEPVTGNKIYFPNIAQEIFNVASTEPSRTADNSLTYDTDAGERILCQWVTSPKEDSNSVFWRLNGYLKGRVGVEETLWLDRLNSTINAYVRVEGFETMFGGSLNDRRELTITIFQK